MTALSSLRAMIDRAMAGLGPKANGPRGRHHNPDHPSRKHDGPPHIRQFLAADHVPEWQRGVPFPDPAARRHDRRAFARAYR